MTEPSDFISPQIDDSLFTPNIDFSRQHIAFQRQKMQVPSSGTSLQEREITRMVLASGETTIFKRDEVEELNASFAKEGFFNGKTEEDLIALYSNMSSLNKYLKELSKENETIINLTPIVQAIRALEIQRMGEIHSGLGDEAWMQYIDGIFHEHGSRVFDTGVHGGASEPGCLSSLMAAHKYVHENLGRSLTSDTYKDIQRHACQHFTGNENGDETLVHRDNLGTFRNPDVPNDGRSTFVSLSNYFSSVSGFKERFAKKFTEKYHEPLPHSHPFLEDILYKLKMYPKYIRDEKDLNFFLKTTYPNNPEYHGKEFSMELFKELDVMNKLFIQEFQSLKIKIEETLHEEELGCEFESDIKIIFKSYQGALFGYNDIKNFEQVLENLFNKFNQQIAQAKNRDEKLLLIAKLFQTLEWLHPLPDGQGRTDLLLLSKLLCEHGFNPPILDDPYVSTFMSLDNWIEYLKNGMEEWLKTKKFLLEGQKLVEEAQKLNEWFQKERGITGETTSKRALVLFKKLWNWQQVAQSKGVDITQAERMVCQIGIELLNEEFSKLAKAYTKGAPDEQLNQAIIDAYAEAQQWENYARILWANSEEERPKIICPYQSLKSSASLKQKVRERYLQEQTVLQNTVDEAARQSFEKMDLKLLLTWQKRIMETQEKIQNWQETLQILELSSELPPIISLNSKKIKALESAIDEAYLDLRVSIRDAIKYGFPLKPFQRRLQELRQEFPKFEGLSQVEKQINSIINGAGGK